MIKMRFNLIVCLLAFLFIMKPAILKGQAAVEEDVLGHAGRNDAGVEQYRSTDLPTALYSMLVEDYGFLKKQKFKGSLALLKIIQPPKAIRSLVAKGDRLLVASTLRKGYRVYVIIPPDQVKYFTTRIKKGEKIYISYYPAGVYAQAPVIRFDANIGEAAKEDKRTITSELSRYYPVREGSEWRIMIGNNLRILTYRIDEVKGSTAKGTVRENTPSGTEPDRVNSLLVVYDPGGINVIEGGTDATGQQFKSSDLVLKAPLKIGTRWTVQRENQEKKRETVAINTSVAIDGRQFGDVLVVREDSIIMMDEQKQYFAATYYFYSGGIGFIGCKITAADTLDTVKTYDMIDDWFIKRME